MFKKSITTSSTRSTLLSSSSVKNCVPSFYGWATFKVLYRHSVMLLSDHHPRGFRGHHPRVRERRRCVYICHLDSNKKQNMPPALSHEQKMMVWKYLNGSLCVCVCVCVCVRERVRGMMFYTLRGETEFWYDICWML